MFKKLKANNDLSSFFKKQNVQNAALLITALKELSNKNKAKILSKVDKDSNNALMLAARERPEAVPEIIEAMSDLEPEVRAKILMQTCCIEGWNALMLACIGFKPEAVISILETKYTTQPKIEIYHRITSIINLGDPPLSKIDIEVLGRLSYQPEAIIPILDSVRTLPPEIQKQVFDQIDKRGFDLLVFAKLYPRVIKMVSDAKAHCEEKCNELPSSCWQKASVPVSQNFDCTFFQQTPDTAGLADPPPKYTP